MAQLVLVFLIIALTIGKLATQPKGRPTGRSDIIGITMGIKTLVFLAYQLLTSHHPRFKRWRSTKAYAILNTLEVLFWFVVLGLTLNGITRICTGASCAFSWMVVLVALAMIVTSVWAAGVTWLDHRYYKRSGVIRGEAPQNVEPYVMESSATPDRSYAK